MSDYPKQMRHSDGYVVTVLAEPNGLDTVPVQWESGVYGILSFSDLRPVPSPDDIVQVSVEMTRAQRDEAATWGRHGPIWGAVIDACRAARDAEGAS